MKNIAILGVVLITLGVLSFYSIIWTQETASILKEPLDEPYEIFQHRHGPHWQWKDLPESIFSQRAEQNIIRFIKISELRPSLTLTLNIDSKDLLIATRKYDYENRYWRKVSVETSISEPELQSVMAKTKAYLIEPSIREQSWISGWIMELTLNGKYYAVNESDLEGSELNELASLLYQIAEQDLIL